MISQQLLGFIKEQLQNGLTKEKITLYLLANGWEAQDIENGFKITDLPKNAAVPFPPPHAINLFFRKDGNSSTYIEKIFFGALLLFSFYAGTYAYLKNDLQNLSIIKNFILNKKDTAVAEKRPSKTTEIDPINLPNIVPKQEVIIANVSLTPIDKAMPIERYLSPGNFAYTSSYNFGNITFRIPSLYTTKKIENANLLRLWFGNNKSVTISKKEKIPNEILNEFLGNAQRSNQIKQILGPDNLRSTYSFNKFVYSITPETISSIPTGMKQNMEKALLTAKKTFLRGNENDSIIIYNFATPNIKGFEYSVSNATIKPVDISDAFDQFGNSYELISTNLTQPEIDYILSSINNTNTLVKIN